MLGVRVIKQLPTREGFISLGFDYFLLSPAQFLFVVSNVWPQLRRTPGPVGVLRESAVGIKEPLVSSVVLSMATGFYQGGFICRCLPVSPEPNVKNHPEFAEASPRNVASNPAACNELKIERSRFSDQRAKVVYAYRIHWQCETLLLVKICPPHNQLRGVFFSVVPLGFFTSHAGDQG